MPVRNTIKQFVDEMGITRYQFAKETGISATTAYGLYENPAQVPHVTVLNKLCDFYRVQPSMFLEWLAPEVATNTITKEEVNSK
jgi:transcriptional regulator with XRE-family HTH domain